MSIVTDAPTLPVLLDDAALISLEHQLHLSEVVGEHSWHADLQSPEFGFTGDNPLTCTAVHLIGTAAPGPRSWLWAWANESGFAPEAVALSLAVRDFGARHGIRELSEAEVPFDAVPNAAGDPVLVAAYLTDAAKAVTGRYTGYQGPAGSGTRVAFLIEHPQFVLPAPEPPRLMRVLQQGLAEIPLHDHRRAVHSYAGRRGLDAAWSPDGAQLELTGPGFTANLDFDEFGRVEKINASLSRP